MVASKAVFISNRIITDSQDNERKNRFSVDYRVNVICHLVFGI